jgi:hypothetical protein
MVYQTHLLIKSAVHTHNCVTQNNAKPACHRAARYKMEWTYTQIKMSGQGNLELVLENRKKRKIDNWLFFKCLLLTCTIVLTNDLGLDTNPINFIPLIRDHQPFKKISIFRARLHCVQFRHQLLIVQAHKTGPRSCQYLHSICTTHEMDGSENDKNSLIRFPIPYRVPLLRYGFRSRW